MTPDEFEKKPGWVQTFMEASERIADEGKGGGADG